MPHVCFIGGPRAILCLLTFLFIVASLRLMWPDVAAPLTPPMLHSSLSAASSSLPFPLNPPTLRSSASVGLVADCLLACSLLHIPSSLSSPPVVDQVQFPLSILRPSLLTLSLISLCSSMFLKVFPFSSASLLNSLIAG